MSQNTTSVLESGPDNEVPTRDEYEAIHGRQQVPFTKPEIKALYDAVSNDKPGEEPDEGQLQLWDAVIRIDYQGWASQLEESESTETPYPAGESWWDDHALNILELQYCVNSYRANQAARGETNYFARQSGNSDSEEDENKLEEESGAEFSGDESGEEWHKQPRTGAAKGKAPVRSPISTANPTSLPPPTQTPLSSSAPAAAPTPTAILGTTSAPIATQEDVDMAEASKIQDDGVQQDVNKIQEQENEIASLKKQIGDREALLQQREQDLGNQIAILNSHIAHREGALRQREQENGNEIADLKSKIEQWEGMLQQRERENGTEIASLKSQIEQHAGMARQREQERISEIANLQEQIEQHKGTMQQLEQARGSEIASLRSQIQERQETLQKREQELMAHKQRVENQDKSLAEHGDKIDELELALDTLKTDVKNERKSFNTERDHLQTGINQLQDEARQRTEQIESLEQRLEKEQSSFAHERTSHKMVQEFLSEIRGDKSQLEEQVSNLQRRIAELQDSDSTVRKLRKQNDELREEQEDLGIKFDVLKKEKESIQSELESSQAQLQEKVDDHEALQWENSKMKTRLDELVLEKSRFDQERLDFENQIDALHSLQAQLSERLEAAHVSQTDDREPLTPITPRPTLKSHNSLADELLGQSDEEEEEDGKSLAETVHITMIEQETQTEPEPKVELPVLTSSVHVVHESAPVDAAPLPKLTPVHLKSSAVQEIISTAPAAAAEPKLEEAISTDVKTTNAAFAFTPFNVLWYLGALLVALLALSLAGQAIEYEAFNSSSASTTSRVVHVTASPIIAIFNALPSARVFPVGFEGKPPLHHLGSHGMGRWFGGLVPIGFSQSNFDPGYFFGDLIFSMERLLGVDRIALA